MTARKTERAAWQIAFAMLQGKKVKIVSFNQANTKRLKKRVNEIIQQLTNADH